jgi:hypothetical protein
MRSHQRGALILLVLLSFALAAAVIVGPSRRTVDAASATNACKSNATGTFSDITVTLTGSGAPNPASVGGGVVTLSGVNFSAAVPATLLVSGYNLGLLTVGPNTIPVKGWVAIAGSNTAEVTQVLTFTASVSTTISDPNGIPGNGDETATPLNLNLSLPDTTWTPLGGNIAFAQGAPGSLPAIPAGQVGPGAVSPQGGVFISAQVAGGLIKANFDCQAGTSAVGGATFTPATAGPFATVTVDGGGATTTAATTTTTGGATTTTSAATTTTAGATTTTAGATTTTAPATTTTLPGPVSGTATYATSCKNSVTPDLSQLSFDGSGTAPAQVDADASFKLSNLAWKVTIPASVFQTGINFGLITPGSTIKGTLDLAITGTNTVQTTQDSAKINLNIPVTTNPDGTAKPATVSFTVADMQWTARSGKMDFSMYGANVSVSIGLPSPVVFVCKPTSGGAFVSSTAVGQSTATTTTAVESGGPVATSTTVAGELVVTGSTGSMLVQLIAGLLLLDIGYLVLSLRRSPRRARA